MAYNLLKKHGEEGLRTLWGSNFETNWISYKMDDIQNGIFHGNGVDHTATMRAYAEKMLNETEHPERQGCVAVTEELAEILDELMHREVFENVEEAFVKLCYYYKHLGPVSQ